VLERADLDAWSLRVAWFPSALIFAVDAATVAITTLRRMQADENAELRALIDRYHRHPVRFGRVP
jgi:hypothetical protein